MKKTFFCIVTVLLIISALIFGRQFFFIEKETESETAEIIAQKACFSLEDISVFGNAGLSLSKEDLFASGYELGDVVTVSFLDEKIDIPSVSAYSDVDSLQTGLFALDKDQNLSLAINMSDFATYYGIALKTVLEDNAYRWDLCEGVSEPVEVTIEMNEKGGYLDQYAIRHIVYSDERKDYPGLSDEEFANFRSIDTTGMGKNVLYRSCSPADDERHRAKYADEALRDHHITHIFNLTNDEEQLLSFEGYEDTYYSSVSHLALKAGMDVRSESFRVIMEQGMRYFSQNQGVYLIHCLEGKDRTGFVSAVLECLMGASYEEVLG